MRHHHYERMTLEEVGELNTGLAIEAARRRKLRAIHQQKALVTAPAPTARTTTQPTIPAQQKKTHCHPSSHHPRDIKPVTHMEPIRQHWLFWVGSGMLLLALGWGFIAGMIIPLVSSIADHFHYGDHQITQTDLDVGHGGISHFLTEYFNGEIIVIEWVSDQQPHIYHLRAQSSDPSIRIDLVPAYIGRHTQPGHPDLKLIPNGRDDGAVPVLYNTGHTFQTTEPEGSTK
ncbi:MAG: hypothetical protein J2P36_14055 [Ktedonobacteraceae bacterium]|nr:hypothetical protein [Ktedonobacteraceae bacterium]